MPIDTLIIGIGYVVWHLASKKKEAKIEAKFEAKRACVVLEKVLSLNIKAKFRYSSFYLKTTVTELFY